MLVNLAEILALTKDKKAAVPAFNVYNMETVMGVIAAAEESNSPVILQGYSRLFDSDNGYYLTAIMLAAAKKATVPVCVHLDHGAGLPEVMRALHWGCTGVMLDRSTLPLEENIAASKEACELCAHAGVPMEGELGHIGAAKDGVSTEHTRTDEAVRFVKETGVAALAILIGTAHGRYKQAPVLNIERIREISEATGLPLVLHGGSGVPDDQIRAAIDAGIKKINFGTDLCYSFLDEVFATSRELVGIDMFMRGPVDAVKKFALSKMELLRAGTIL